MALSISTPAPTSNVAGEVKGSHTDVNLVDHIEWYGFSHEIVAPRDAATGLPTGKRQHRPLTAIKRMDKASPLLQDTLTKNGTFDKIEFHFWRPTPAGAEEHYFTITLEEATISSIRTEQLNNKYPENMAHETREYVSFTYDKITWEEIVAGTMAFDSWKETVRGG